MDIGDERVESSDTEVDDEMYIKVELSDTEVDDEMYIKVESSDTEVDVDNCLIKSERSDTGYDTQSSCATQCEGWSEMLNKTKSMKRQDLEFKKQRESDIDIENTDEDDIDIEKIVPCDLKRINKWRNETFDLLEKKNKQCCVIRTKEPAFFQYTCIQEQTHANHASKHNCLERKRRLALAKLYQTLFHVIWNGRKTDQSANSKKLVLKTATITIRNLTNEEKELKQLKSSLEIEKVKKLNELDKLMWCGQDKSSGLHIEEEHLSLRTDVVIPHTLPSIPPAIKLGSNSKQNFGSFLFGNDFQESRNKLGEEKEIAYSGVTGKITNGNILKGARTMIERLSVKLDRIKEIEHIAVFDFNENLRKLKQFGCTIHIVVKLDTVLVNITYNNKHLKCISLTKELGIRVLELTSTFDTIVNDDIQNSNEHASRAAPESLKNYRKKLDGTKPTCLANELKRKFNSNSHISQQHDNVASEMISDDDCETTFDTGIDTDDDTLVIDFSEELDSSTDEKETNNSIFDTNPLVTMVTMDGKMNLSNVSDNNNNTVISRDVCFATTKSDISNKNEIDFDTDYHGNNGGLDRLFPVIDIYETKLDIFTDCHSTLDKHNISELDDNGNINISTDGEDDIYLILDEISSDDSSIILDTTLSNHVHSGNSSIEDHITDTDDKLEAAVDTDDKIEGAVDMDDKLEAAIDMDDKLQAVIDTNDKFETADGTDDKFQTDVDTDDKLKTAVDTDDKLETTVDMDDKLEAAVDTNDKFETADGTDDKFQTDVDTDDKLKTVVDTDDKLETAVDMDDKLEAAVDTDDKFETADGMDDKFETAVETDDKLKGAVDTEDKFQAAVDTDDKYIVLDCWITSDTEFLSSASDGDGDDEYGDASDHSERESFINTNKKSRYLSSTVQRLMSNLGKRKLVESEKLTKTKQANDLNVEPVTEQTKHGNADDDGHSNREENTHNIPEKSPQLAKLYPDIPIVSSENNTMPTEHNNKFAAEKSDYNSSQTRHNNDKFSKTKLQYKLNQFKKKFKITLENVLKKDYSDDVSKNTCLYYDGNKNLSEHSSATVKKSEKQQCCAHKRIGKQYVTSLIRDNRLVQLKEFFINIEPLDPALITLKTVNHKTPVHKPEVKKYPGKCMSRTILDIHSQINKSVHSVFERNSDNIIEDTPSQSTTKHNIDFSFLSNEMQEHMFKSNIHVKDSLWNDVVKVATSKRNFECSNLKAASGLCMENSEDKTNYVECSNQSEKNILDNINKFTAPHTTKSYNDDEIHGNIYQFVEDQNQLNREEAKLVRDNDIFNILNKVDDTISEHCAEKQVDKKLSNKKILRDIVESIQIHNDDEIHENICQSVEVQNQFVTEYDLVEAKLVRDDDIFTILNKVDDTISEHCVEKQVDEKLPNKKVLQNIFESIQIGGDFETERKDFEDETQNTPNENYQDHSDFIENLLSDYKPMVFLTIPEKLQNANVNMDIHPNNNKINKTFFTNTDEALLNSNNIKQDKIFQSNIVNTSRISKMLPALEGLQSIDLKSLNDSAYSQDTYDGITFKFNPTSKELLVSDCESFNNTEKLQIRPIISKLDDDKMLNNYDALSISTINDNIMSDGLDSTFTHTAINEHMLDEASDSAASVNDQKISANIGKIISCNVPVIPITYKNKTNNTYQVKPDNNQDEIPTANKTTTESMMKHNGLFKDVCMRRSYQHHNNKNSFISNKSKKVSRVHEILDKAHEQWNHNIKRNEEQYKKRKTNHLRTHHHDLCYSGNKRMKLLDVLPPKIDDCKLDQDRVKELRELKKKKCKNIGPVLVTSSRENFIHQQQLKRKKTKYTALDSDKMADSIYLKKRQKTLLIDRTEHTANSKTNGRGFIKCSDGKYDLNYKINNNSLRKVRGSAYKEKEQYAFNREQISSPCIKITEVQLKNKYYEHVKEPCLHDKPINEKVQLPRHQDTSADSMEISHQNEPVMLCDFRIVLKNIKDDKNFDISNPSLNYLKSMAVVGKNHDKNVDKTESDMEEDITKAIIEEDVTTRDDLKSMDVVGKNHDKNVDKTESDIEEDITKAIIEEDVTTRDNLKSMAVVEKKHDEIVDKAESDEAITKKMRISCETNTNKNKDLTVRYDIKEDNTDKKTKHKISNVPRKKQVTNLNDFLAYSDEEIQGEKEKETEITSNSFDTIKYDIYGNILIPIPSHVNDTDSLLKLLRQYSVSV